MGMASYYRTFIEGFSNIAVPLFALTKKNVKFVWTDECQKAFDKLKLALVSAPVLAYPDFDRPFYLFTDASDHSLGVVLSQFRDNKEHPIAYYGRQFTSAEANYNCTEREFLGLLEGIRKFKSYLFNQHFTAITDHKAIQHIMSMKEPSGRIARWLVELSAYNFTV